MMDVITATTTKPYRPRNTVHILPIGVIATKSPNPIVVTTAKQYHRASGKLVIFGSTDTKTNENATTITNKPNKTSKENVLRIILIKILTFSCAKAIVIASTNETIAMNIHSTSMTVWTSSKVLEGTLNRPIHMPKANSMIKTFKKMFLAFGLLITLKIRERIIVQQYAPAVIENRIGLSLANKVITPKIRFTNSKTIHFIR